MIELTADHLLRLRGLTDRRGPAMSVTSLPGGLVTRPRGRGLETAELRAFAPGDDPRHLDRNATARTGQPHVRLFHAERDRTTILIADFRPSMLWGTRRTLRSIAAAEALTLAGWAAVAAGERVGLIIVTAAEAVLLTPRERDRAMVRVIGGMVRAHRKALANPAAADPSLADSLALAARASPRGAEVVLASALDHLGAGFEDRARALASSAEFRILRIADAFETAPPPDRYRFATRTRPEGRIGRPVASSGPHALIEELNLPVQTFHAARPPEAQAYG